jgi:hypothetical protein
MAILVPISLAELYDKISILEIKMEKICDKGKLLNVANELERLCAISKDHPISDKDYCELRTINERIWVLEEMIRRGLKFGETARDIYLCNDVRSKIKRRINEEYGSEIIEEKSY